MTRILRLQQTARERRDTISPEFIEPLQAFLDGDHEGQTDQQISDDLLIMVLSLARIKAGVEHKSAAEVAVFDQMFMKKLGALESDDPRFAIFENVMHRLTHSDCARAATYLNKSIELKQQQISRDQSRRASTPRVEHPLKTILREIIIKVPGKTAKGYLALLIVYVKEKGLAMDGRCTYEDTEREFSFEDISIDSIKCSTVTNKWVGSILNG